MNSEAETSVSGRKHCIWSAEVSELACAVGVSGQAVFQWMTHVRFKCSPCWDDTVPFSPQSSLVLNDLMGSAQILRGFMEYANYYLMITCSKRCQYTALRPQETSHHAPYSCIYCGWTPLCSTDSILLSQRLFVPGSFLLEFPSIHPHPLLHFPPSEYYSLHPSKPDQCSLRRRLFLISPVRTTSFSIVNSLFWVLLEWPLVWGLSVPHLLNHLCLTPPLESLFEEEA